MDFINKENDILALTNFFHEFLHAFFKLASDTCTLDKAYNIKANDFFSLKFIRYVSVHNFLSQSFNNRRFTNTRFSDEDGIVLGSTIEDFDDADDFFITSNDWVNISVTGNFCDIDSIFIQKALFLDRRRCLSRPTILRTIATVSTITTTRLSWRSIRRWFKIVQIMEKITERIKITIV